MGNLEQTHPQIASQWHPTRNGNVRPSDVSSGSSSKKYFWNCQYGHVWESIISNRTKGSGCPVCANKIALAGFNDLASKFPALADEWDVSKNKVSASDVVAGSNRKAWWLCKLGHSWEAVIASRTGQGTGCPYCSGTKILSGFNDLETMNPDYLSEWNHERNSIKPRDVGPAVKVMAWWTCTEGHDYERTTLEKSAGYGCPFCKSRKILPGFNDFKSEFPLSSKFWDEEKNGKPASLARKSSPELFWFKCSQGHSYRAATNHFSRNSDGASGCSICAGRTLLVGFNDLATVSPELAALWHPTRNGTTTPSDVTRGSSKAVWWLCSVDSKHEWKSKINNRSSGRGCPICVNRLVVAGVNDLLTVAPSLAAQWHKSLNSVDPKSVGAGSLKKVFWVCTDDPRHVWEATIASRAKTGVGCLVCSNRVTISGVNDLASTHPALAQELNEGRSLVSAKQLNASSIKGVWWDCSSCGAAWKATPSNRSRNHSGCPKCSKTGYDPTAEGYLYLLTRDEGTIQQFGISNVPEQRIAKHKRNGWEVLDVMGPADGYWVLETETALKMFFKKKGVLLDGALLDKFDGYTESWVSTELSFSSVSKMLTALRDYES
jgi:hypothetical protein